MIVRYTCDNCGLVTRVEEGQNHKACSCNATYTVELEIDPAPVDPPPSDAP